ncbi:hypothetical protein ACFQU7_25350 [Pseudoroseomonas wenyumeiae]
MLRAISQKDVLDAAGMPPEDRVEQCNAFFYCGTPLESRAGTEGLESPDFDAARALLKDSGYDGRRVVFLDAADLFTNHAATLVMAEAFRKIGINVDVVTTDFATLTARRNKREPVEQGLEPLHHRGQCAGWRRPALQPLSGFPLPGWSEWLAMRREAGGAATRLVSGAGFRQASRTGR